MEIKITFERDDDLCGCEITDEGKTLFWESGLDRHKEYGKEDKMDAAYEMVVWLLENGHIKKSLISSNGRIKF